MKFSNEGQGFNKFDFTILFLVKIEKEK